MKLCSRVKITIEDLKAMREVKINIAILNGFKKTCIKKMIATTVKLETTDMLIKIRLILVKIMEIKVHLRMKMGGKHYQMRL